MSDGELHDVGCVPREERSTSWSDILEFSCVLVNCRIHTALPEFEVPTWAEYETDSAFRIRLRPLTAKENSEYLPHHPNSRAPWPILACSAVICHADASGAMSVDALTSAREWLLRCFRLLKPGFLWMTYRPLYHVFDQAVLYGMQIPPVVLQRSDVEHLHRLMVCIRASGLGLHEREILSHKWIRIMALSPETRRKERSLYLEVALSAFERANENGPVYVDCLIDFIVALEALYLIENDELSFRLANRVAALLGRSPEMRVMTQDEIRSFYRDRNYLIHGAAKALGHKYDIGRLREHVRRSLLCHIALKGLGKERLIEELDKSLFKTSGAHALRAACREFYGSKLAVALKL